MEVYIPSKTSAHIFLMLADFHLRVYITEMVVKPEENEVTADKKQQHVNK